MATGSGGASPAAVCVDLDGDGFGSGCAAGPDCDDANPAVTQQCFQCPTPKPGCACANEGEQVVCGAVDMTIGQQHTCGAGLSVCANGVWGECIINSTVTLIPSSPSPPPSPKSLGAPTSCAQNPCDPFCQSFPDDPSNLTDADAGIVSNDAGITLVDPIYGPPAATTCTGGTLGSCNHSVCSTGDKLATGCDGSLACVASVCALHPSCCGSKWDGYCVAWAQSLCNIACGSKSGVCVVCYKDSVDHDGDGYSWAQGDCADCDPSVNPGAYDFPGNGIDEDCSGVADDEPTSCDTGLTMASSTAGDYAKAIDLCRVTTAGATGAAKKWGVTSATLAQADGVSAPQSLSYGILSKFGSNNLPQKGARMAAFSSGTARAPGDTGYFNPNGQGSSQKGYQQNTTCNYPAGFPKNKAGCANATGSAFDSTGLVMNVRAPTNAKSFTYRFNFFTSEYPEYVCNKYNDAFVALLTTGYVPANPASNSKNISFDSNGNPVNVNIGLFNVTSGPQLFGTGFDGTCKSPFTGVYEICGGATGWLETSAPIVPGETITLQFAIWDASDRLWDSIVLVDAFAWSEKPATIQTSVPPAPPVAQYSPGTFVRDYDLTGVCPAEQVPQWGLFSWNSVTPKDSSIQFEVQAAASASEIASAPKDLLIFSDPPGPSSLAGQAAVAAAGAVNTNAGSVIVDATLRANSRSPNLPVLRVTSNLLPSTDKLAAPTLSAWNLQFDCIIAE